MFNFSIIVILLCTGECLDIILNAFAFMYYIAGHSRSAIPVEAAMATNAATTGTGAACIALVFKNSFTLVLHSVSYCYQ